MALFLLTKAILANEPIDVFNHGKIIGYFTYVYDFAKGVVRLLDQTHEPNLEYDSIKADAARFSAPYLVFNIRNHCPIPLMEFIASIEHSVGRHAIKVFLPLHGGGRPRDASRRRATGRMNRLPVSDIGAGGYPSLRCRVSQVLQSLMTIGRRLAGPQTHPNWRETMKVTTIGTGYVGLVTGACLAEMGNHVVCLDVNTDKIRVLNEGGIPIHEPGLDAVVKRNVAAGRLHFTTDVDAAVNHGTILFIAVGTPPGEDGSADLQYVLAAARSIGERMTDYKVIVDKSTVPVGTADRVRATISDELTRRGSDANFSVVSNPEFLKEGAAIEDFMKPDRIIVGSDDEQATLMMRALYAPFTRSHDRLFVMDVKSAEFTKYAANAMLATRISFMNELALLAEKVGADIELVRRGIGSDPRIGYQFLYAGAGYGGSCFPKDVKALVRTGRACGQELKVLNAVEEANERQKLVLVDKVVARFGKDLEGRRFALWGLAFKPNTDDMREAPSLVLIEELVRRGASVVAYDPVAMGEARKLLTQLSSVSFCERAEQVLAGSDALIVITEWKEFRTPDFSRIKAELKQPVIFDGRNLYEPATMMSLGLEHYAIGRGASRVERK
jgi:UDPglucose 6-dehydrogenase